mgnify:CR=1 FL=1
MVSIAELTSNAGLETWLMRPNATVESTLFLDKNGCVS